MQDLHVGPLDTTVSPLMPTSKPTNHRILGIGDFLTNGTQHALVSRSGTMGTERRAVTGSDGIFDISHGNLECILICPLQMMHLSYPYRFLASFISSFLSSSLTFASIVAYTFIGSQPNFANSPCPALTTSNSSSRA